MRLKRSTVIPIVLLIYLAVMSCIGYPDYAAGIYSPLYYFGIIGVTLIVIFLLHLSLKRRERLKREREEDMKKDRH